MKSFTEHSWLQSGLIDLLAIVTIIGAVIVYTVPSLYRTVYRTESAPAAAPLQPFHATSR